MEENMMEVTFLVKAARESTKAIGVVFIPVS